MAKSLQQFVKLAGFECWERQWPHIGSADACVWRSGSQVAATFLQNLGEKVAVRGGVDHENQSFQRHRIEERLEFENTAGIVFREVAQVHEDRFGAVDEPV